MFSSAHYPLNITGLSTFEDPRFNTFQLVTGRLPGPGQIALESSDRSVTAVTVGSQIEVEVGGVAKALTVSGFVRTRGLPSATLLGTAYGYMHESDVQTLFNAPGANDYLVRLNDYNQRSLPARRLAGILRDQHVVVLAANIGHSDGGDSAVLHGIFAVVQVLAVIALVLSIVLLLSTITALITEQTRAIGTMKAIGASRGQIMRLYLTSVAAYGVLGTILGLVLGTLSGWLIVNFFASLLTLDIGPLTITPEGVLLAAAVGIGAPLLAALPPVYLGTRISVHQALSGYGLTNGSPSRSGVWSRIARRTLAPLPMAMQMGARSLFRRRSRAMLTLLTLVVAGAVFLCVQTTTYSFESLLSQLFGTYHADIFASLSNPEPYPKVQQILSTIPGVAESEPLAQILVQTKWGNGLLTGVEPTAHLYQKRLVSGRWFAPGENNVVVLSTNAADKSGLKIGDSIAFHTALQSGRWKIIGIAQDDDDPLGLGVVLAPISEVQTFLQLPSDFTEVVMIRGTNSSQSAIDALATQVDDALSRSGVQATVLTTHSETVSNQDQFNVIFALFYAVTVIVALVGVMGLFNALTMSVLERRREIGILRSMGATGTKIAQVFWTEAISLGVVAWIGALVVGIPCAYAFVWLLGGLFVPVPFAFDPVALILMLGFILAVAILASAWPVWSATRTRVSQVLSYE
jgi:putative ABC transport system permease protein